MMEKIPHDGIRSRKLWMTAGGTAIIEVIATAGWWLGKMDPNQWVMLNQWLWPVALSVFCGTNVIEKFAQVPAKPSRAKKSKSE